MTETVKETFARLVQQHDNVTRAR